MKKLLLADFDLFYEKKSWPFQKFHLINSMEFNVKITNNSGTNFKGILKLGVPLDGNPILIFESFESIINDRFYKWRLDGENENFFINCESVVISYTQNQIDILKNVNSNWLLLKFEKRVVIKNKNKSERIDNIIHYISNFISEEIKLKINDYNINFQPYPELHTQGEIKESLIHNIIDEAITSSIKVTKNNSTISIEEAYEIVDNLIWMLYPISSNQITTKLQLNFAKNANIISIILFPMGKLKYNNYLNVLDNFRTSNGLSWYLQNCYTRFAEFRNKYSLCTFIHLLRESHKSELPLEIKLYCQIAALENISYNILTHDPELDKDSLLDMNLNSKLNRLNNEYLRFFKKNIININNLRNPLMHQGIIPALTTPEKVSFYLEYYEIALNIFFVMVEYKGKYYYYDNPSNYRHANFILKEPMSPNSPPKKF